jgi:signal peptidase I
MLRKVAAISFWSVTVVLLTTAALLLVVRLGGYELLSVQTDSMTPAIRTGAAVIVARADRDIREGEVVSYVSPQNDPQNPGVIVTHRVVSTDWKRGTFIARGDNSPVSDLPVPMSSLHGTVSRAIPLAGYGLDAFRDPFGLALVVYVPALGIIVEEVRRLTRHYSGNYPHSSRRCIRYVLYARVR